MQSNSNSNLKEGHNFKWQCHEAAKSDLAMVNIEPNIDMISAPPHPHPQPQIQKK